MDPLKLAASVDLNSPQFGVDQNCEVGKAKLFCVPARKTVHVPSVPSPLEHMTGPDAGDRICYQVKCKSPGSAPDTLAADQFGARKLKKLKARIVCTPAVKVKPGWLGRIEIDTLPGHIEQYWTDSDGVRPEAAGCHTAFANKNIDGVCLTPIVDPDSVFGEFCLPAAQDGFPAGSLVESNPAAGVCHPHKNQKGHPDVYDCDAFCKGTVGWGMHGGHESLWSEE
jgi:hypothetical protein